MKRFNWGRDRRLIKLGMVVVFAFFVYRWFTPGIPVLRGPSVEPAAYVEGKTLFLHNWRANDPLAHGDGLGPVFNDTSCAACHNLGGVGGGGGNTHNVHTYFVFPPSTRSHVKVGVVHAHSVTPDNKETDGWIPIESDERLVTTDLNSTALFGGGWIDKISERAVRFEENRELLSSTGNELTGTVYFAAGGRARVLPDGRIGKFGWKAQFATLDEFVAAACANEVGLGSPLMKQATPLGRKAVEAAADLNAAQFDSLAAFVRGLPRPIRIVPSDAAEFAASERGRKLFDTIECAWCHVPDLGGVSGIYTDLLLHTIKEPKDPFTGDAGGWGVTFQRVEELDAPGENEWRTPPLWGVADSAPYLHDGSAPTLDAAILRHGGDSIHVMRRYKNMDPVDRAAIVSFLLSLRAPVEHEPSNVSPAATLVDAKK